VNSTINFANRIHPASGFVSASIISPLTFVTPKHWDEDE